MFSISKLWVLLVLSLFIFLDVAYAQVQKVDLSLEAAIEQTIQGNHQIRIAGYELESAQSDVDNSKNAYLPSIQGTITGALTNLPLNVFGSRLQQGRVEQQDFLPASLNSPSVISNLQSQLMIHQPVLNPDVLSMKSAAISKTKAFEQQVLSTEHMLRYQVEQTYLGLQLTYEVEQVLLNANGTAKANLSLVQDNVDVGYLHQVDALSVEVRINQIENQLFEARSNIQNASDQLSFFMNHDLGTQYLPTERLSDDLVEILIADTLLNHRSDVKAMGFQIEAQQHMLDALDKSKLPRINAMGSYEVNNSLDFAEGQHGFMVMVQASWSIFDGKRNKQKTQKAMIELEKNRAHLNQLRSKKQLDLQHCKRSMKESRNTIRLTERAILQSKEYLRVKTDRFEEGLEKTTDLLMAETAVVQKEMDYVKAIYHFKLAQAELNYLLEQK